MYTNTTGLMTEPTETLDPDEAIRMETVAEAPQNLATIAYVGNPTRENLDRLYRATIDHGQAVMQLIKSIERKRAA